jgi:NhaP-type Na+/H+ or K+/H+ antiporter
MVPGCALEMKTKVWIWTGILAFLGYLVAGKSAIENARSEIIGLLAGAVLGFAMGWALQRHDEKRGARNP